MNTAERMPTVVARSAAMRDVLERATSIARAEGHTVLYGETGVGRELIARVIHTGGATGDAPFSVLRCDALLPGDLDQVASGSTVLLRGLMNATPAQHAVLLRGLDRCAPARVRMIAALGPNPLRGDRDSAVEEIFFRLACHELSVPALRAHAEDIAPIANHFLQRANRQRSRPLRGFAIDAVAALETYSWPGNVRELEDCVLRAGVSARGEIVERSNISFSGSLRDRKTCGFEATPDNLRAARAQFERLHVERVLAKYSGDKRRAAEALGIDVSSLYRKIPKPAPD
jgi:two-component system NtrC family response regulator